MIEPWEVHYLQHTLLCEDVIHGLPAHRLLVCAAITTCTVHMKGTLEIAVESMTMYFGEFSND